MRARCATLLALLVALLAVAHVNAAKADTRAKDESLLQTMDKERVAAGLSQPPFEKLPSMAPLDDLDRRLVNPLANPASVSDGFASRLAALPDAGFVIGTARPNNDLVMTPSGALPPIVAGISSPESAGLTPPILERSSLPPFDVLSNAPPPPPQRSNPPLVPPNPQWTNPANTVSSPDSFATFNAQKQRLEALRNQHMQRMEGRNSDIKHYQAYVEGGDAWIAKMEDQLNKWLAQERRRGSVSIRNEQTQVAAYKKVLGQLQAQQQNDARQINIINTELRRLETQYKLNEQRLRLQSTLEEQKQLQSQLQLSGKKKDEMEKQLAELNAVLSKIQTGASKVSGKGQGKGKGKGKGKGGDEGAGKKSGEKAKKSDDESAEGGDSEKKGKKKAKAKKEEESESE